MKKLKVMTIVGTRPELIRLSEIIKKEDVFFDHIFVHTGQNYDKRLNDIFYDDLGIRKPDFYLNVAGTNLGMTMGAIIEKSYDLMRKMKPDALLILGDTNSALSAISAKRLKIPIFHMEAGNRCFDENLPEEINRRIVDHISDVNLPYTEHARRNLIEEGISREYVYVTGSPMREVIYTNQEKINSSDIRSRLEVDVKKYILLSAHREENIDNERNFFNLMTAVNAMTEKYQMPVIYSIHPRSMKYINERNFVFHPLLKKMPPFNFTDYSALMKDAYCVVSDSGTIPEEASIERFPAVCIRTSTERPEALERGCFTIGGISQDSLLQAIELAVKDVLPISERELVNDYQVLNVSSTIIHIIQSYTRIIDERIWRK